MALILTLLALAAAALGAALVVLLVVLACPVLVVATAVTEPRPRLIVGARLLGGLSPLIRLHDTARKPSAKGRGAEPSDQPGAGEQPIPAKPAKGWSAAKMSRAARAAPRLLLELLGAIRLRRLDMGGQIGLDDPADTGALFGWLAAFAYAPPPGATVSINLQPDFDGPRFDVKAEAEARFTPLAFAPPALRFALAVYGGRR